MLETTVGRKLHARDTPGFSLVTPYSSSAHTTQHTIDTTKSAPSTGVAASGMGMHHASRRRQQRPALEVMSRRLTTPCAEVRASATTGTKHKKTGKLFWNDRNERSMHGWVAFCQHRKLSKRFRVLCQVDDLRECCRAPQPRGRAAAINVVLPQRWRWPTATRVARRQRRVRALNALTSTTCGLSCDVVCDVSGLFADFCQRLSAVRHGLEARLSRRQHPRAHAHRVARAPSAPTLER